MLKTWSHKSKPQESGLRSSELGEVIDDPASSHDAVFGDISRKGPNYRNVGWLGTVALMMKTQIGLGVLSIPAAFDTLGIVPGVLVLCAISAITTWSDCIVGVFKLRHREVYSIDDAGQLMFGRIGREVMGVAFCLSGSGMLGISIGLNAVSTHGTCTATLGRISWLAWIGLICILSSILTVTVAVGIQDRPASAPQTGEWSSDFKIINHPSFTEAITAVSAIVFAFAGTPAFFAIASEMRDPKLYTRSLIICQSGVTAIYIAIGCVVYYFCGSFVASPALGSAGTTMKKVCYGLALPGLMVTTILVIHLPGKYMFVRFLRGTKHLASNTIIHWATWFGCTFGVTAIAYLIASAIPVFGGLVSLIGALLGTFLSFMPMGCMWLYDNWARGKTEKTWSWRLMVLWSVFVIVSGTFLMISGTYGSVVGIMDSYEESGGSAAFSCADNSNST
ncbi:N amino acid transport system protein like [Verticillium longisporum]|nr:N amino acid transport system protein like [Verticillium longisporum]